MPMRLDVPETAGPDEPHAVFRDASWAFYEALSHEYDETPTRVNYDRGTLEIMTLSVEHEGYKDAVGLLVNEISTEFEVQIATRGSATLKLEAKKRGLEADHSCWIANEAVIRPVKRLDLTSHPPPDLVLEVDIAHAVVDRESIYAALGVPEMWHFDTQTGLTAWERAGDEWVRIEFSKSLPMVRVADLTPFLRRWWTDGQMRVLRDFRTWLKTLPR